MPGSILQPEAGDSVMLRKGLAAGEPQRPASGLARMADRCRDPRNGAGGLA
jgi:hypothetical protein